jgi:hypothetical protein
VEYEATCTRAEHVWASGLQIHKMTNFLDALAAWGEPRGMCSLCRPQVRQPIDELVLEAPVSAPGDAIVSFDGKGVVDALQRFGIEVLWPCQAPAQVPASPHG